MGAATTDRPGAANFLLRKATWPEAPLRTREMSTPNAANRLSTVIVYRSDMVGGMLPTLSADRLENALISFQTPSTLL